MSGGDTQQDGKGVQTFEEYDFENDDGWLNIIRRIDFTTQSEEKKKILLEKRKRKYFNKCVNPSNDATSSSSTAGAGGASSSEPEQNKSASDSSEAAGNTAPSADKAPATDVPPSQEAKDDTPPARGSGGSAEKKTEGEPKSAESARGSSSGSSSARPQSGQSAWSSRRKFIVPLNYADWIFSMITVLATLSHFLPVLFSGVASYRTALISVICSKLTGFVLEVVKSQQALAWRNVLALFQRSFNLQLAWGAVILLLLDASSRMNFVFLAPSALRAAYFSVICTRAVMQSFAPRMLESARVQSAIQSVVSRGTEIQRLASEVEVWNGIILVGLWLTPSRSMIATFMYWSGYLQRLYIYPGYGDTKAAFYNVKANFNQLFYHPKCPTILRTVYQKVCDFMYTFVDPVRLAQAQNQSQRCVIM